MGLFRINRELQFSLQPWPATGKSQHSKEGVHFYRQKKEAGKAGTKIPWLFIGWVVSVKERDSLKKNKTKQNLILLWSLAS